MGLVRRILAVMMIALVSLANATGASRALAFEHPAASSNLDGNVHYHADANRHGHAAHGEDALAANSDADADCGEHGHDCTGCAQHCASPAFLDSVAAGLLRIDMRVSRLLLNDRGAAQVRHDFDRPPRTS